MRFLATSTSSILTFTTSPIDLILPEGITLFEGQSTPNIKVQIVPKKKSITVKRAITISGLGENLTATVTSGSQTVNVKNNGTIKINATITLTGSNFVLDSLTETDIIAKLSFDNKGAGSYELTPTVSLSASIASEVSAQLVSPTQVSVSIK